MFKQVKLALSLTLLLVAGSVILLILDHQDNIEMRRVKHTQAPACLEPGVVIPSYAVTSVPTKPGMTGGINYDQIPPTLFTSKDCCSKSGETVHVCQVRWQDDYGDYDFFVKSRAECVASRQAIFFDEVWTRCL